MALERVNQAAGQLAVNYTFIWRLVHAFFPDANRSQSHFWKKGTPLHEPETQSTLLRHDSPFGNLAWHVGRIPPPIVEHRPDAQSLLFAHLKELGNLAWHLANNPSPMSEHRPDSQFLSFKHVVPFPN